MSLFKKNKFFELGGILFPKKIQKGYKCFYCPKTIYIHNEVDEKLHKEKGENICVMCRIIKSNKKLAEEIVGDKKLFDKDQKELYTLKQEKANKVAIDVAIASQQQFEEVRLKK